LVSGEIARAAACGARDLLVQLDGRMARTEPDPRIQELLGEGEGLNIGLDYLPARHLRPAHRPPMRGQGTPGILDRLVRPLVTNVDRTPRTRTAGLAPQSLDDRSGGR